MLLQQPLQLQFLQYSPLAKHSQYNFRHREFLQLQFFLPELIPGMLTFVPVKVGGKYTPGDCKTFDWLGILLTILIKINNFIFRMGAIL
jgi:hypothetical protein